MRPSGRSGLTLLLLAAQLCACAREAPADIVLIVVDTLRADRMGCYGADPSPTPNLDRLARRGVRFQAAMATSSWTRPAVASIITGRYPDELGLDRMMTALPTSVPTLAEILGATGYSSLAVLSNTVAGPKFGYDRGYEQVIFEPYKTTLHGGRPGFTADRITDEALALWEARDPDRPTFLHVHYTDPHEPYLAPRVHRDRYLEGHEPLDEQYLLDQGYLAEERLGRARLASLDASYRAEIAFADHEIGRLLDAVGPEATVVLISDHGEEFQEHGAFLHGNTLYEEVVHVPVLIRSAEAPAGLVVEPPVSQVDLLPTLLELAGIPRPEPHRVSGASLVPHFGEPSPRGEPVVSLLNRTQHEGSAVRRGRWKLQVLSEGERTGTFLHDLRTDPGEQRCVAAENPEVVELLQACIEDRERSLTVVPSVTDADGDAERLDALRAMGYLR